MNRNLDSSSGENKGARWPPPNAPGRAGSKADSLQFSNSGLNSAGPGQLFPSPLAIPTSAALTPGVSPSGLNPPSGNFGGTPLSALQSQYAALNMMNSLNMMGLGYNFGGVGVPQFPLTLQTSGLSPSMGSMSPIAAAAAAGGQAFQRTIYVGHLPDNASVDELLNLVKFGPIESVNIVGKLSCAFISFLDTATAAAFLADVSVKRPNLRGKDLTFGWGNASAVPPSVLVAVQHSNATRNVFIGNLDDNITEATLRDEFSKYGLIDQVKIVRDKQIGFVHFLSIQTAIDAVSGLQKDPQWSSKRVGYGKDRCAFIPKTTPAAQAAMNVAGSTLTQTPTLFSPFTPLGGLDFMTGQAQLSAGAPLSAGANAVNRTIYLGNIHPETTTDELCNAIRGGVLQSIRYMQDKHVAFVTFIDPAAAFTFYQMASYQGLTLNNRRLKVGWGKVSAPLTTTLALAVHSGATRNVYVGGIEDYEVFSEEKLRHDFGEYGDIELVNFLKEKNCAFVNFTNIANAIKAIDALKNNPEYSKLRISHGKDRCANAPRSNTAPGSARKPTGPQVSITSPTADDAADDEEIAAAEQALLKEQELEAQSLAYNSRAE